MLPIDDLDLSCSYERRVDVAAGADCARPAWRALLRPWCWRRSDEILRVATHLRFKELVNTRRMSPVSSILVQNSLNASIDSVSILVALWSSSTVVVLVLIEIFTSRSVLGRVGCVLKRASIDSMVS